MNTYPLSPVIALNVTQRSLLRGNMPHGTTMLFDPHIQALRVPFRLRILNCFKVPFHKPGGGDDRAVRIARKSVCLLRVARVIQSELDFDS